MRRACQPGGPVADIDPDPVRPDVRDAPAPAPDWGQPRQRTVTWHDPIAMAAAGAQRSGRDVLQAMVDGVLPPPPITRLLEFVLVEVGDGEVRFRAVPGESAYNAMGVVHGGLMCTLLDSATGCAVHSTLPAGVGYASIEVKVGYLRPVHGDSGELTVHGWVTKPGRRVAFADADVRDAAGRLMATASSSMLIRAA
jgi:uncharacterized protein (TIGR00369 family)